MLTRREIALIIVFYLMVLVITFDPLMSAITLPISALCVFLMRKSENSKWTTVFFVNAFNFAIFFGTAFFFVTERFSFYPNDPRLKNIAKVYGISIIAGLLLACHTEWLKRLKAKRSRKNS
jgi:hypothetical protein